MDIFAGAQVKHFQRKEGSFFGKSYDIQVTFIFFFFKYIRVLVLAAVSVGGLHYISAQQRRQLVKSGDEVVKTTLPWTVNLSTHESETQTM